jgi:hypothetical protein
VIPQPSLGPVQKNIPDQAPKSIQKLLLRFVLGNKGVWEGVACLYGISPESWALLLLEF